MSHPAAYFLIVAVLAVLTVLAFARALAT